MEKLNATPNPHDDFSSILSPMCSLSCVWLFVTLWTVACQAPLSMEFSRQGYWSRLPCSSPRNLPDPVIEPTSLASPALAGRFFTSCTILIQPKYSTNSSNSITHFLHMFTFWIVGFVSFSSHFPHVCVCVYFSLNCLTVTGKHHTPLPLNTWVCIF